MRDKLLVLVEITSGGLSLYLAQPPDRQKVNKKLHQNKSCDCTYSVREREKPLIKVQAGYASVGVVQADIQWNSSQYLTTHPGLAAPAVKDIIGWCLLIDLSCPSLSSLDRLKVPPAKRIELLVNKNLSVSATAGTTTT